MPFIHDWKSISKSQLVKRTQLIIFVIEVLKSAYVSGGTLPKPETNSVKNLAKVPNTVEGGSSRASVDHPQASSIAQSPVRLGLAAAAGNDSDNSSSPPPTKFNLE